MKPDELPRTLKQKPDSTVFILTGEERLLKEEAVEQITTAVNARGPEPYTVRTVFPQQSLQGDTRIEPAEILDDLRSRSLFGGRTMLVLHDAGFFYGRYKTSLNSYFAAPSKANVLVIAIPTFRATQAITAAGTVAVVGCDAPYDSAPPWKKGGPAFDTPLAGWTVARATSSYKKRITKPTAYALTLRTGRSLERIDGELEKLALYLGERAEISEADIEAVCGGDRRGSLFVLTQRFFDRKRTATLSTTRQLFDRGFTDRGGAAVADPSAIALIAVSMLHTELRKLRRLKSAQKRGEPADAIKKMLGYRQDFQMQSALERARRWKSSELRALLAALTRLDLAMKSTGAAPAPALEQLILTHLPAR